ncbi:MAG TPA: phage portal protein [Pyrinomonadaceae bacterium]
MTADWLYSPTSTNQILYGDLRQLRQRSRDLARNDPYAKKFFRLVRNNVIGKGVTLQVRPSGTSLKSDAALSKKVETSFYNWGKKETCSTSTKLSWIAAQQLFIMHVARDGEALVRFVYDKNNKFGFSLKFYNPAWLDETYTDTLPNGNRVIMSVEVDEFDRPVAYYLTQPAGEFPHRKQPRYRTRVPSEQILHKFLIEEDEDQARGIPWLHAAMIRFKHFEGYEEAEIIGKRAEACQMAFIVPPEDTTQQTTAESEDEEGRRVQPIQELEPGAIAELPPGYDVKNFNPKQDGGAPDFKKSVLRSIAAAGDVSYHSLAGDLEAVNFSSARIGSLEERDNYSALQVFVIENFCEPVYAAWLESAFLSGALQISAKDLERVNEPMFRGRGWSWVNPKDDADAAVTGLENGFMTLTDILAEKGIDIEDHFETLKKEKALAKKYGIVLKHGNPENPDASDEPIENELDPIEIIKREADAYGVAVRAGAITPQTDDEKVFREKMVLPEMSPEAQKAWQEDGGVRRPITLASSDGSHPASNGNSDTTDAEKEDKSGD